MRPLILLSTLALAGPAAPDVPVQAVEGTEVFQNDAGCFCVLPKIMPKRWASVSTVAYGVAAGPGGMLLVAGTRLREAEHLGSGWTVEAFDGGGTVAWSRTFVWQEHYYDVARGLAVDSTGRVIAAGYAEHSKNGPHPTHWLVGAYGADGTPLWHDRIRDLNFIRAEAVAVDSRDRVYVAGWKSLRAYEPSSQWLIRSYTRDGRLRWIQTFEGPVQGRHRASAIAATPDGEVVVAGNVDEGAGRWSWCLRKYNGFGDVVWSRSIMEPGSVLDQPSSIAVDAEGRIAVAGKVFGGDQQGTNWSIRLFDAEGKPIWNRAYNGPMSFDDKAHAVGFDACGNVLVGGFENGDETRQEPYDAGDWIVQRYSRGGDLVAALRPAELEVGPGSPYAFTLRDDRSVTLVGFEAAQEAGKTRWVQRRLKKVPCR